MDLSAIKISSDAVLQLGPITVTNSMLATFLVTVVLILVAVLLRSRLKLIPGRLQVAVEELVKFFLDKLTVAFDSEEKARKVLPLIFTLFLLILFANQFSIVPLISSLVVDSNAALVKTPTADFSLPIALALIVVVLANIIALVISPLRHIGNFIKIAPLVKARSLKDFANALLEIFLGLLDIIGELAKVISLAARLFGNVLAGELMVVIITYLAAFTHYVIPIPFIFLSIFSGVIHAFVFPLLSIQYLAGSVDGVAQPQEQPQKA